MSQEPEDWREAVEAEAAKNTGMSSAAEIIKRMVDAGELDFLDVIEAPAGKTVATKVGRRTER